MRKVFFFLLVLLSFALARNTNVSERKLDSIINLFNSLPEKYRNLGEKIDRKELSENPGLRKIVMVNDQKNGYLTISNYFEGRFTMAVWRLKSNQVIVGITNTSCGPICKYQTFTFLSFDGSNWKDVKAAILPPINFSLLEKKYNLKKSADDEPFSKSWVQYELPRIGTTIKITMQMSDIHLADLVWKSNKFVFNIL